MAEEPVLRAVEEVLVNRGINPDKTEEVAREVIAAMSDATDPRELGGSIAGPGGPFDMGGVVIDGSKAILMHEMDIAKIDPEAGARGNDEMFAVVVKGRINQTQETGSAVVFCDLDGLAALITEAHGVAERAGSRYERVLRGLCQGRWRKMPHPEAP